MIYLEIPGPLLLVKKNESTVVPTRLLVLHPPCASNWGYLANEILGPRRNGSRCGFQAHPLHLPTVRLPPLHKVVPSYGAGLTLVSPEFDAPPDLFGDPSRPTGLMDRAIDRFDLIPSLSGHDLRQVRSTERLLIVRRGC